MGLNFIPDPKMHRKPSGRPTITRIHNEMDQSTKSTLKNVLIIIMKVTIGKIVHIDNDVSFYIYLFALH